MEDETKPVGSEVRAGGDQGTSPDDRIVLTKEALGQRLERARKSAFKAEFGTEDPTEIKGRLDALAKFEAEREEARKAALSREQQLSEEVAREKAGREKAEHDATAARFEARTSRMFAELGIRSPDYATFKLQSEIARHAAEKPGEKLDEKAFLSSLLGDRRERVALGLDDEASVAPGGIPTPPRDTSPGAGHAPPPPAAGAPRATKSAFDMSAAEWTAFQAKNGI